MGLVETEAIVLHTFRLAEADKIAVCMTQKAGLIRGVARGARRLKSRFGASLEPFTHINLTFFEKETRELVTIKSAEIIKSYFTAAKSNEAIASLDYLVELVKEFASPNHADEKLFRMLRACVESLANDPQTSQAIFVYAELWALKLTGFLPDFKFCGGCGENLMEKSVARVYISSEGVIWCGECYKGGGRLLNEEIFGLLTSMPTLRPPSWSEAFSRVSVPNRQATSAITRGLIKRVLEKDIKGGRLLHSPDPKSIIQVRIRD